MEIANLFPTPVGIFKVPVSFKKFIPHLEKNTHRIDPDYASKEYGTRSLNSYILDLPELKEFNEYISDKIYEYSTNALNLSIKNYKITQSWVSYKNPNQSHKTHQHPNSIISGVFYWADNALQNPKITFTKTQVSTTWILSPQKQQNSNHNNSNYEGVIDITLTPGSIILFPSYLPHGVEENSTDEKRKSLAFNSIPTNRLGAEEELTEFKYKT